VTPADFRGSAGLTLLEIIVTIAITSVVMGAVVAFMDRVIHFKGTADTIQRFEKIEDAFEVLYRENIRDVEENCHGWTDDGCKALAVLPSRDTSDTSGTRLLITTRSDAAVSAFGDANCALVPDVSPVYRATCMDGYGFDFTFATANEHPAGSVYLNGYNRTPYSVTITAGGNTSMTDTWSSGHLDSEYMVRSQEKLLTVARAMKSYHLSRLTVEAVSNPCSGQGGLASNDDILIPWIWQATGSHAGEKCFGTITSRCGCSGFDGTFWSTDGTRNITNSNTISGFLASITAGSAYRTDGFGNPVTIGLITRADGTPISSAPPAPCPKWTWSAALPPYGGTVGVMVGERWVYSQRVIYAQ
jgi:type II secretory pathway pseudopilin PulG